MSSALLRQSIETFSTGQPGGVLNEESSSVEQVYEYLKAAEPRFLKVTLPGGISSMQRLPDGDIPIEVVTSVPSWYARQDLERLAFSMRSRHCFCRGRKPCYCWLIGVLRP
jgi:hypothetical protein